MLDVIDAVAATGSAGQGRHFTTAPRRRLQFRRIGPEMRARMVVMVVVVVAAPDEAQARRTDDFVRPLATGPGRLCVSIAQRRNGRHPQIVQLDDSVVTAVLILAVVARILVQLLAGHLDLNVRPRHLLPLR